MLNNFILVIIKYLNDIIYLDKGVYMKKKFKLLLLILMVLIIPTGCMKIEAGVTINKDGSMDYALITALEKEYANNDTTNKIDEDTIKDYKKKNINVDNYEDDKYKGYIYSVHYDNIDQLSSMADDTSCTINITEKEIDNVYCFKKENNLFSTKYTARFNASFADSQVKDATDQAGSEYAEQILKNMDLKFKVKLPVKPGKNNATTQDGNTLTWDFMDSNLKNEKYIEFEFETPNKLVIVLAAIACVIVVSLVIAIIIATINKNKNKPVEEKEEVEETLEIPQQSNPVVNALLSPDGNDINNLNK
jgi:hypothetical protein